MRMLLAVDPGRLQLIEYTKKKEFLFYFDESGIFVETRCKDQVPLLDDEREEEGGGLKADAWRVLASYEQHGVEKEHLWWESWLLLGFVASDELSDDAAKVTKTSLFPL